MKDGFGREIDYLRISITDKCNLRCRYCMPESGIVKKNHTDILTLEEIEYIANEFVKIGIKKIRITGGEPLVRKGVVQLVKNISKIDGIEEVAMTTNGELFEKYAQDLFISGLSNVNFSLDTLNEKKYKYITRGGELSTALKGIDAAVKTGFKNIKINAVLIGSFNEDEIEDYKRFLRQGIDVRFIELMPIGEASKWALKRFIPLDKVVERFGLTEQIFGDESSAAKYYKVEEYSGRVGLINSISCKFCNKCNRIRVTADGKIKGCLHQNSEIDIKTPLRNGEDILEIIKTVIFEKPHGHNILKEKPVSRNMSEIGG